MDFSKTAFLPDLPLKFDGVFWTALALVVAALAGEFFFRKLRWPRVIGYSLTGFIAGSLGKSIDLAHLNSGLRVVLDIALAVLLFELGSRANLRWIRANPWLLVTSITEAFLTFASAALLLLWLGVTTEVALGVAAIAMSTAPVVITRVTAELNADGQVTERLMLLTALNCVYAVLGVNVVLGWLHSAHTNDAVFSIAHPLYLVGGSLLLAALLASVVSTIARRLDLKDENAAILLIGLLLLATAATRMFKFSPLLVPLLAGMMLRARDPRPRVWPRHFGTAGGVLVVLLFFVTGMTLSVKMLIAGGFAALGLVLVRAASKFVGVSLFARPSGISWKQGALLGLALCPMSGVAFALAVDLYSAYRDFGDQLGPPILGAIAILELTGPLILQWALHRSGETHTA